MLELAIWKSKIVEQTDGVIYLLDADLKMACCIDSLTMVGIVIPNVLSFLRGDFPHCHCLHRENVDNTGFLRGENNS